MKSRLEQSGVNIAPLGSEDALLIQRQPSQRVQLGLSREMTPEEAASLADGPGEGWTARDPDGRLLACFGLRETFPNRQAVAWAILAPDLRRAHLTITRFARARIATSPLARIEALVRADCPAEVTWARLVGLEPLCVLRAFGAASEPHVLFERVREAV